jgi:hypothetical protein
MTPRAMLEKWPAMLSAAATGAIAGGSTPTSAPSRNSPKPMKKAVSAATIWLRVNDDAMMPMAMYADAISRQPK